MSEKMSVFDTLNRINVNDKTEKKNGLTYLSWAWAWGEVKKNFPEATFTIYERQTDFGAVNYFTDGRTCWVKTGLTINGLEHIEELPVMDFRNNSIPYERVTSTDVNKAIQRSLTKAAARHGLGLYIYAGEDIPEEEKQDKKDDIPAPNERKQPTADITTSDKIPQVDEKERAAVKAYLLSAMKDLQEMRQISAQENKEIFKTQKEQLVKDGLVPDKRSEDYTLTEAQNLIDLMHKRFSPSGKVIK